MSTTTTLGLLRIAPLLSSTAAVTMTLCEDVFFRPFGTPNRALRPQANQLLASHFRAAAPFAMSMTATFYFSAIGLAVANLAVLNGNLGLSGSSTSGRELLSACCYLAGSVFNGLHFAFAPRDLALMDVIMDPNKAEAGKGKDNCSAMTEWVGMNVSRGLVADFPGFICNLLGFVLSLSD
ncbi:hypothetical protein F5Y04DRAFT_248311 [Hypomontagnella monticulosa]|nr:hypothetical protein F5Y04DRAFT_248311 [Hypomontagnella monticulosa]